MLCGATQDRQVMVERSDKTWSIGEGNGKPLHILALRTPWIVWKGGKIGRWEVHSPGRQEPTHPCDKRDSFCSFSARPRRASCSLRCELAEQQRASAENDTHYASCSGNLRMLSCSVAFDSATSWTVAHQAPLSMGQEYWVSCHFLLQGIFLTLGSNPISRILYHWAT